MHITDGMSVLWKDTRCAQIGVDPRSGVALTSLCEAEVELVCALTRPHSESEFALRADSLHIPRSRAQRIVAMLDSAGLLTPENNRCVDDAALQRARRHRPHERGNTHVHIVNLDHLGVGIAHVLADSGVGAISTADSGTVSPYDHPFLARTMVGMEKIQALNIALRERCVPVNMDPNSLPTLAVLTGSYGVDPYVSQNLLAQGIPVLHAWVGEIDITIGPLTIPHSTPCARCVYLSRIDEDPSWAVIAPQAFAAQQIVPHVATRDLAVAAASREILGFLDGYSSQLCHYSWILPPPPVPPSMRHVTAHPLCGCGANIDYAPLEAEQDSECALMTSTIAGP